LGSVCLLEGGAPDDELDSEAAALVPRIGHIQTPADAAREVSSVFSRAFEPEYFTVDACSGVGTKLYPSLEAAGLLAAQKAEPGDAADREQACRLRLD
jgi:hypothetical protein